MATLTKVEARLAEMSGNGDNRALINKVLKKLASLPAYTQGYLATRKPRMTVKDNPYSSPAQKGQARDWKDGFSDAQKVKDAGLWAHIIRLARPVSP